MPNLNTPLEEITAPESSTKKQVHAYGLLILFFVVVLGIFISTLFFIYQNTQQENSNKVDTTFIKEVDKMRELMSRKINNSTQEILDTLQQTRQEVADLRTDFSSFKTSFKTEVMEVVDSCLKKSASLVKTTPKKKLTTSTNTSTTLVSRKFLTKEEFNKIKDSIFQTLTIHHNTLNNHEDRITVLENRRSSSDTVRMVQTNILRSGTPLPASVITRDSSMVSESTAGDRHPWF